MKLWLSTAEIAAQALPGLPTSRRGIQFYLDRNARAGLARPRAGRGGGKEYHIKLLPTEARAAYVARHATAHDVPAAIAREAAQDMATVALGARATEARDARLALFGVAERYAADAQLSHRIAKECLAALYFAALYDGGQIEIAPWIEKEVKALAARAHDLRMEGRS